MKIFKFETQEELLLAIIKNIPYPQLIDEFDLKIEKEAIVFVWNDVKYIAYMRGNVGEIQGDVAEPTHAAIFLEHLIQVGIRTDMFRDDNKEDIDQIKKSADKINR